MITGVIGMVKNIVSAVLFGIGMSCIWCVALHSAAGIGLGILFGVAFASSIGLIRKGRKKTDSEKNTDEVVK